MKNLGIKSIQTVTSDGDELYSNLIDGVVVRHAVTHVDDRGSLTEIFSSAWNICPEPVGHFYRVTVRPNKIKGWSIHQNQTDRMFFYQGISKLVLYDAREDSKTFHQLNEFYFGEEKLAYVTIPQNVYHAVHNVGYIDSAFINMPTRAYNYENPDRHRLPATTSEIPYDFFKMNIGK